MPHGAAELPGFEFDPPVETWNVAPVDSGSGEGSLPRGGRPGSGGPVPGPSPPPPPPARAGRTQGHLETEHSHRPAAPAPRARGNRRAPRREAGSVLDEVEAGQADSPRPRRGAPAHSASTHEAVPPGGPKEADHARVRCARAYATRPHDPPPATAGSGRSRGSGRLGAHGERSRRVHAPVGDDVGRGAQRTGEPPGVRPRLVRARHAQENRHRQAARAARAHQPPSGWDRDRPAAARSRGDTREEHVTGADLPAHTDSERARGSAGGGLA